MYMYIYIYIYVCVCVYVFTNNCTIIRYNNVYFLLGISPASNCSWPTFRNHVSVPSSKAGCTVWGVRGSKVFFFCLASSHTSHCTPSLWRWNWHRVPKRRPTTIWRRGNAQKKIYNIQITAKVWNQDTIMFRPFSAIFREALNKGNTIMAPYIKNVL